MSFLFEKFLFSDKKKVFYFRRGEFLNIQTFDIKIPNMVIFKRNSPGISEFPHFLGPSSAVRFRRVSAVTRGRWTLPVNRCCPTSGPGSEV